MEQRVQRNECEHVEKMSNERLPNNSDWKEKKKGRLWENCPDNVEEYMKVKGKRNQHVVARNGE